MNPSAEMPFLDHLEELRWRLFKAAGAVAVGCAVGFFLVQRFKVLDLLLRPIAEFLPEGKLAVFNPVTPFFLILKLSLLVGAVLAFPIVVYQVWAFLAPALDSREKKVIVPSLYLGLVLFAVGVALAYLLALPVSLRFLLNIQSEFLTSVIGADEYLSFVVRLLLAFGILFELPVVVMILTALGVATPQFLREKRRHAMVLITVVAAFLSPGDVVMVTVMMMAPLFLLYELSILLSAMIYRRRHAEQQAEREAAEAADERRRATPPEGSVEAGR